MFPQSSSWSTTKRILLSTLLVVSLLLPIYPQLLATMGCAHAQSAGQIRQASKDLIEKVNNGRGGDLVRVIIQPAGAWDSPLDSTVGSSGGSNIRQFQNFRIRAVTISADAALALSTRNDVAYVSLNREVRTLGHVSLTTGADAVRTGEVSTGNGVDGTGIGIAVLDSGIDPEHRAFLDRSNNLRVMASQDFTGEGRTDDPYGHGTHVASIAAGSNRSNSGAYMGIAPKANVINLRVLNAQGAGTVSSVLSALDWVMLNRAAYNVRVVN